MYVNDYKIYNNLTDKNQEDILPAQDLELVNKMHQLDL